MGLFNLTDQDLREIEIAAPWNDYNPLHYYAMMSKPRCVPRVRVHGVYGGVECACACAWCVWWCRVCVRVCRVCMVVYSVCARVHGVRGGV